MRKILGTKRGGVTGGRRKLYEELYSMDCSPHIVRVMNERGRAGRKVLIDKRDTKDVGWEFCVQFQLYRYVEN
jgi:hypothetical protein